MTKLVLDNVVGGFNLNKINSNFQKIEDELQNKVLYRNNPVGEPNGLSADIDANSKRILNLPFPASNNEPVRYGDVAGILPGGGLLAASNGSSLVGFLQAGTGAVARTVEGKLQDTLNVKDYCNGGGVVDDTTKLTQLVAYAVSSGKALMWNNEACLTTANIPLLHTVRHLGRGSILRGANTFYIGIKEGETNTLNVSPAGLSTNDGLSTGQSMSVLSAASALVAYGPLLQGRWKVVHAAGTYTASNAFQIINLRSTNRIEFVGPSASFGVPTAIYDMTGAALTYAMWFGGEMMIKIEDIKIINATTGGALAAALVLDNGPNCWARNLHIDNCPGYALNANINTRTLIEGGKYSNCQYGIKIYNSVSTIGYNAQRVSVANCTVGVLVQKSYSHTDYVDYDNCAYGIQSMLGAHTTNYFCTFNNVTRPWQAGATSTISTENVTYTGTSPTFGRAQTSPFTADTTPYLFEQQFYSTGTNGRSAYGYTDWVVPTVKYQYSNNGTTAGFNLSSYSPATALYESNGNTILALAAPDVNYSAIWFGDSTSASRAELRGTGGTFVMRFGATSYFRFRSTDIAPVTDVSLTNGTTTLRWLNTYTQNVVLSPPASVTPANNGDVTFQFTSNTQLTIKAKGSDGVVRSVNLTLA